MQPTSDPWGAIIILQDLHVLLAGRHRNVPPCPSLPLNWVTGIFDCREKAVQRGLVCGCDYSDIFFLYRFNPLLLRFSDGIHQELNLPLAIRECIEENLLTMRPSAHWACLFIPKIRQCKSVFWNKQNQSWAGMNISQITPWLHQQLAVCSIQKISGNFKCRKILCGEHLLSASTFDSDRNSRRSLNSTGRDKSASFRILAKKLT